MSDGCDVVSLSKKYLEVDKIWHGVCDQLEFMECPSFCGGRQGNIMSMIIHLNDYHKFSFEMIADWLEEYDLDAKCILEPTSV